MTELLEKAIERMKKKLEASEQDAIALIKSHCQVNLDLRDRLPRKAATVPVEKLPAIAYF
jgi:hypothetical protein